MLGINTSQYAKMPLKEPSLDAPICKQLCSQSLSKIDRVEETRVRLTTPLSVARQDKSNQRNKSMSLKVSVKGDAPSRNAICSEFGIRNDLIRHYFMPWLKNGIITKCPHPKIPLVNTRLAVSQCQTIALDFTVRNSLFIIALIPSAKKLTYFQDLFVTPCFSCF